MATNAFGDTITEPATNVFGDAVTQPRQPMQQVDINGPDATGPAGNFWQAGVAGFGKSFVDLKRRGQQVYAYAADKIDPQAPTMAQLVTGQDPSRSAAVQKDIDESARLDQPLMSTAGGIAGDLAGSVAQSLVVPGGAVKLIPALARTAGAVRGAIAAVPLVGKVAAPILSGAAQGAAYAGIAQPTTSEETTLGNAGMGALAGGVIGPVAASVARGAVKLGSGVSNFIANRAAAPGLANDATTLIQNAMQAKGLNFGSLAPEAQTALVNDVKGAIGSGGTLDADQLGRLIDLRSVGATPSRGSVSLDPAQLTVEKNLAKVGANQGGAAKGLAFRESDNNNALIGAINNQGASGAPGEYATGNALIDALQTTDQAAKNRVSQLYQKAEGLNGGQITLDGASFVNNATNALDQARRGAFLPGDVRSVMQGVMERAQNGVPMTLNDAEQLRTILAASSRTAQRAGDGNATNAIGLVRNALEAEQPASLAGQDAVAAFARARGAHAARMQMQENSPALAAAVDGAEPDQFFKKFITSGNATAADLGAMKTAIQNSPQALDAARSQIVDNLKTSALNGAADEVGTFSQSAFNKALGKIGDQKLGVFFSPAEIAQLKQIGRASSYLQVQPKGSAVNNSNTASALAMTALNKLAPIIPYGDAVLTRPINNLLQMRAVSNATNNLLDVTNPGRAVSLDTRNRLLSSIPTPGGFGAAGTQQYDSYQSRK